MAERSRVYRHAMAFHGIFWMSALVTRLWGLAMTPDRQQLMRLATARIMMFCSAGSVIALLDGLVPDD
jgi:hypothetical protein